jgi:hypothetical protein
MLIPPCPRLSPSITLLFHKHLDCSDERITGFNHLPDFSISRRKGILKVSSVPTVFLFLSKTVTALTYDSG